MLKCRDYYVKELLDAKGNLPYFRDVAHRVGGVLSLKYVEEYPHSHNTVLIPVLRAGSAFEKSFLKRVFPSLDFAISRQKEIAKHLSLKFCIKNGKIMKKPTRR